MKEHRVVNVETTGVSSNSIEINNRFFRANHYISEEFKHFPVHVPNTLIRQTRGEKRILEVEQSPDGLLQILWDDSVFLNLKDTDGKYQTNYTIQAEISDDIHLKYYDRNTRHQEYQEIRLSELLKL